MNKILLNEEYPSILSSTVDNIIQYNLVFKAKHLLDLLKKELNNEKDDLKNNTKLSKFYKKKLFILSFIALQLLDEKEIISLFKKHFLFQFSITNYDVIDKFNKKLINIYLLEDRNKFKEEIKKALSENIEKITVNHKYKTIKDWLRDYIVKVDYNQDNSLAKAQYLTSLRNDKNINPKEYRNISVLFDLHDLCNLKSDTPFGIDEETLIIKNGKLYIFRKGFLDELRPIKGIGEIEKLFSNDSSNNNDQEKKYDQVDSTDKTIKKLEKAIQNYSSHSLEYKAINEEIAKLKK